MVIRTYFDKNNTIISDEIINTAKNPVTELFYGGPQNENKYSRFLFHFDTKRLKSYYTGGTFTDLSKLTHRLKLTNTGTFNSGLLNTTMANKVRTTSFDLIVFKLNEEWDEGTGYDYNISNFFYGNSALSTNPSNWLYAKTGIYWTGGSGTFTGSSSTVIGTQHFDNGNENIDIDITSYVNGVLTGDTNYGLGIAFSRPYELLYTNEFQYVGFFTKNTQTFYEPFVETIYDNHIVDDRNNFYLDKPNKLYLYVNLNGVPTNLDQLPNVEVKNQYGQTFSSYTQDMVTHVTKGVYSINLTVPTTTANTSDYIFTDTWNDIIINGNTRPPVTLQFPLRNSDGYFNIGEMDMEAKRVAVTISGIKHDEKIKRGDIRKVLVSTRIPYTVEQTIRPSILEYRLYVKEGTAEYTVTEFHEVEMANNINYFLIDTESLIPNTYYIDIKYGSNQEINTLKNVLSFDIVSESNIRVSQ